MNNSKEWKARLEAIKKLGTLPKKWKSGSMLAHFIARIDPYLLFSDHSLIHELLGTIERKGKDGSTTQKAVLPLPTAKRLMQSEGYLKKRDELMTANFSEDVQRIGRKSLLQWERLVDAGDKDMVTKGLEMSGLYTRGIRVTRVDDKKKNKELANLSKDAFDFEKIETELNAKE